MAKKKTKKNSKDLYRPRVLIIGFVILFVVLIVEGFGQIEQKDAEEWVNHTSEVKTNIRKLLSDLQDAETGQRGFLLTDELRYLEPFEAGLEDTPITLQKLNELTSDNPRQQANIEEIQILINKKFAELQLTINLYRVGSKNAAIEVVKSDTGKMVMDQIRGKITDMLGEEDRLFQERQARVSRVILFVEITEILGLILLIVLAGVVYRQISQTLRIAREAQAKAIEHAKNLKIAAVELEHSNDNLETFVYVASHDLKSPLKGINTLASWIQEDLGDALTGESAENFKLLRSRVKRMETLLDGILTYSLASRENLKSQRVNLNDVIKTLVEMLDIPKDFKIKITNKLPGVMGPKSSFEQIFSNLLNNAIKHHDKKSGTITITAKDAGEFWEFLVTDDGPGIAPKYHDLIFERFQTLQSRDDIEGSGLGLSIVKKLVAKQGGEIFVDSKEGQRGTTFRFTWKKLKTMTTKPKTKGEKVGTKRYPYSSNR